MAAGGLLTIAAVAYVAYQLGSHGEHIRSRREVGRLQQRLETFARLLAPIGPALKAGDESFYIPKRDLAVLALLVEHPGQDGETLAAMEEDLRPGEPPDPE